MAGHILGRFCIRRDYVILLGFHIELWKAVLEFRETQFVKAFLLDAG
jgi:hypothetical protein